MRRTALPSETRKSPLARCRELSNAFNEWSNIFDSLKNEKKHIRYKALNVTVCGNVSQKRNNNCNFSMSSVGRMVGFKGAFIFSALRYN